MDPERRLGRWPSGLANTNISNGGHRKVTPERPPHASAVWHLPPAWTGSWDASGTPSLQSGFHGTAWESWSRSCEGCFSSSSFVILSLAHRLPRPAWPHWKHPRRQNFFQLSTHYPRPTPHAHLPFNRYVSRTMLLH